MSHIIVTDLDLSEFEQRYSNDQTGAPAYDPAILTQARKELYKQTLEKKISKLSRWLKQHDDKIGKSGKAIQSNITDNDSAKMRTSKGVIQGYNGVAVADGKHLTQPEKDIQIWTAVEHQLMAG